MTTKETYKVGKDQHEQMMKSLDGLNRLRKLYAEASGVAAYQRPGSELLHNLLPQIEDDLHAALTEALTHFEKEEA